MKNYMMLVILVLLPFLAQANPYADDIFELCCDKNDHVSNSYMYTLPIAQNLATRNALWNNFRYVKQGQQRASFQSAFVYQKSLGFNKTRHYFLPCKCDDVLVSGDAVSPNRPLRHIRAEWLNLPSTFQGSFTLNPKQQQIGAFLEFNQDLAKIVSHDFFKHSWISFCIPVVSVKNNMHIVQDIMATSTEAPLSDARPAPTTIIQAFQQSDWGYAKIKCGSLQKVGLADLNFQFGTTFHAHDYSIVAAYSTIIIPTGNIQNAEFLFEPVLGNNGHFGIGTGVNFQCAVNRDTTCHALCYFLDFESIFFARNHQWRTFDLLGKPYSRYLQFVRKDDPSGTLIPGVNILTLNVQVHPYNIANFSTGFRWKTSNMEIEAGYAIWGHGPEKIVLFCKDQFGRDVPDGGCPLYGIAGNQNAPNQLPELNNCQLPVPATASKSTIECQAANDVVCAPNAAVIIGECSGPLINNNGQTQQVFVPITKYDIDTQSAASQSTFNHKFQIAFGYIYTTCPLEMFVGAGVYYDKPVKSGGLNVLGGWAKLGASF